MIYVVVDYDGQPVRDKEGYVVAFITKSEAKSIQVGYYPGATVKAFIPKEKLL